MPVRRRRPPTEEIDLDATDELPIVDFAAVIEESLTSTDTFILPAVPAGVSDLAEKLREIESRLQGRNERLAQVEAALEAAQQREQALRRQLDSERAAILDVAADADRRLADSERELASVRAEFERREDALLAAQVEIDAQRRSLAAARNDVEQRSAAIRHQAVDLAELRSRCERQLEALQSVQGWRAVADAQIAERDEALDALRRQLDRQLRAAAGQESSPEPGAHQADAEAARAAAAVYEEQQFQIAQLQAELAQSQQHAQRLDEDLRIAEEKIDRLEGELRASASLLGEGPEDSAATGTVVALTGDEGAGDTGARPELRVIESGLPARLFVRQEGGADVSYPLGRRTTIGRTPDNDIQIDTTYISRHHAVVLSNSQDCIIEDLNSTNGVLVNGRRVGRQVLHDGDSVTVGDTVFTFQQPA